MHSHTQKLSRGYTLLFAILASVLVLQITITVLSTSRKQFLLSTAARESMYAIYAADTGIECTVQADVSVTSPTTFYCTGRAFTPVWNLVGGANLYTFIIPVESSCAQVSVKKGFDVNGNPTTSIESKGYSVGDETECPKVSQKTVERALRLTY